MKKLVMFVCFFVAGIAQEVLSSEKQKVVGEWAYDAPMAEAYGYDRGTIVISEKDGKLAGEAKFSDGCKIDLKNVVFEEDVLKFGLYIDYDYISVKVTVKDNKFDGTVSTPDGDMNVTGKKVIKKAKKL